MKIEKDLEDLLLHFNVKTGIDVLILDKKEVMYFIGDTEKCIEYLYAPISDELKRNRLEYNKLYVLNANLLSISDQTYIYFNSEAIYKLKNNILVFLKKDSSMKENDITSIESTI